MTKGQRVELHPATDRWMMGDRFGVVSGFGRPILTHDKASGRAVVFRPVFVTLDKSGKRVKFHPANVVTLS